MKTSMITFNLTFKAEPFFRLFRKVVQIDWKCRLFLKQNNFTLYFIQKFLFNFGNVWDSFKENPCLFLCICCLFILCRILFSFIHPLEHLPGRPTQVWSEKDIGTSFRQKWRHKLLGSCRRLRLGYVKKYFFKKCLFCACGLYNRPYHWIRIIKFLSARHWDFIWWSSRSTYEQRPVSDV